MSKKTSRKYLCQDIDQGCHTPIDKILCTFSVFPLLLVFCTVLFFLHKNSIHFITTTLAGAYTSIDPLWTTMTNAITGMFSNSRFATKTIILQHDPTTTLVSHLIFKTSNLSCIGGKFPVIYISVKKWTSKFPVFPVPWVKNFITLVKYFTNVKSKN